MTAMRPAWSASGELLFLEGVYVDRPAGSVRFWWVKAPTSHGLTRLSHAIAHCIGRFLERYGLLERDAENRYLAGDALDAGPMDQLLGHSITYRIAVGPQQGRKVFTLKTLPACDEPCTDGGGGVRIIACIEDPAVIEKILTHLMEKAAPEPAGLLPEGRAPPPVCRQRTGRQTSRYS